MFVFFDDPPASRAVDKNRIRKIHPGHPIDKHIYVTRDPILFQYRLPVIEFNILIKMHEIRVADCHDPDVQRELAIQVGPVFVNLSEQGGSDLSRT